MVTTHVMKINVIINIYLHYNIKINNYFFGNYVLIQTLTVHYQKHLAVLLLKLLHCQYIVSTLSVHCQYIVYTMY